ncbi:FliH/SctL family protein [Undibacterium sp. TJN25]|uniref:FliH/SctL family protein n=1 Tax=Undibacterium sp. TJN25 TaxID=3413056 RepID=UPI003BF0102D
MARVAVTPPPVAADVPVSDGELQRNEQDEIELEQRVQQRVQQELSRLGAEAESRGFEDGMKKGEETARKAAIEKLQHLTTIASSLIDTRKMILDEAEDAVVEIAYAAICKMLGETAATRQGVVGAVAQTAKSFQQNEDLVVRLHPADFEMISALSGEAGIPSVDTRWELAVDASIELGGCIVDGSSGTLDARLETQMQTLREALLKVRAGNRSSEEAR